jgi:hypothetical protein
MWPKINLVVVKVRERLAVCKQAVQAFYVEISNLRKIGEMEVRKQYQTKLTNRFAAFSTLKKMSKSQVRHSSSV